MSNTTPLAVFVDLMLHKAVPETAEPPYLGPVTAVAALEEGPDDVNLKRNAAQLMVAIAQSRRFRFELVERGAIELLSEQFTSQDKDTRLYAMQALVHLALDPKARSRLHSSNVVEALLVHLQRPVCGTDEAEEVLRVFQCLLTAPAIRARFVELDGMLRMADFVISGSSIQKERAAFVLWMLAAIPSLQSLFFSTKAIPALVHALDEGASDLTDVVLSALALLAEDRRCRDALVNERVLERLSRVAENDAREEVAYRMELLEELLSVPQRV